MHHEAVAKRETGIKQFCEILKEDARLCSLNTGIAVINVHKNVEFPAMCSPQVPNSSLGREKKNLFIISLGHLSPQLCFHCHGHPCALFPPVCHCQMMFKVALESVSTGKPTTSKHNFCILMLTHNV